MWFSEERDQRSAWPGMSDVLDVELLAQLGFVVQQSFESRALDAMKQSRSLGRIGKRWWKQKQLVFRSHCEQRVASSEPRV